MGYTTRKHAHGTTRHFWPDNTETELYLTSPQDGDSILEAIENKWPRCFYSRL